MSDQPTCKTCRFWRDVSASVYVPAGWGSCAAIPDRFDDTPDRQPLAVTGEDDDRSFILTSPSFGCVMHQPATVAEPVGWSEDPPSVPGWYWYYHRSLASPLVCRVYTTPKNVWAEWGGGRRSNVKHWSGQWLPIITPTVADTTPAGT